MAKWSIAPAVKQVFAEVNARWPNRKRGWDGTIGDTRHQARRSDHNPDWKLDKDGIVRAGDITTEGIDVEAVKTALKRDWRIAYIIHDRIIQRRKAGWKRERYTGPNPHDHHVHFSLLSADNSEDYTTREQRRRAALSTAPFGIWPITASTTTTDPDWRIFMTAPLPQPIRADMQRIAESAVNAQKDVIAERVVERLLAAQLGTSGPSVAVALQDGYHVERRNAARLDEIEQRLAALEGRE